ncbi:DUF4388 domain-containing protein [Stenomitos frigidus]|uniref:PatA-like N-terminal domain-containing protein n=1 Tax=Stenomitos frigidus ULC18 TaxID=2107698 RepID=A0A2T1DX22_9CYAN|nr:DUF4388 domain-containing protein [Stenomitos frigidus]PSB24934.1 hypothetical protein C7B82_25015 [Stenomitos frigidus ULC18]
MAVTGYLSEFSVAEIFNFLHHGSKTGLLTICTLLETEDEERENHYIWFSQGRVLAAANQLDQHGLAYMIGQRGWLGEHTALRVAQTCAATTPIGLSLKSQGLLTVEQLKLLFYTQVMRQVCRLFALKDGWFQFDGKAPLPFAEMTGLNAPPPEVTLTTLRVLKDWSALVSRLPEPTSTIMSVITGKPQLRLDQAEWRLWEFANGTLSLQTIAQQLQLPVEKVQQIAFRLVTAGLVEEVPLAMAMPAAPTAELPPMALKAEPLPIEATATEATPVSQSFLHHLVGFLKGKV